MALETFKKIRDGEPLGGRTNAADDFATDVDDDFYHENPQHRYRNI